jgi:hypothetical protein
MTDSDDALDRATERQEEILATEFVEACKAGAAALVRTPGAGKQGHMLIGGMLSDMESTRPIYAADFMRLLMLSVASSDSVLAMSTRPAVAIAMRALVDNVSPWAAIHALLPLQMASTDEAVKAASSVLVKSMSNEYAAQYCDAAAFEELSEVMA